MNRIKDYKALAEDIISWIKNYAQENNIQSLVVGVSGGIDSAVVSTLCAVTGLPTYCAVIDIKSKWVEKNRAFDHIDLLCTRPNVSKLHFNLDRTLMEFRESVSCENDLLVANAKSRLRMMTLYQVAGTTSGIVVGTGNKIEDFGIGFATKGGDFQCDISPIADLYKTEVRELGKYLGVIPSIIEAPSTDGLFLDGRTDEDQIGCTYEELEWVMEPVKGTTKYTDRQIEVSKIYLSLNKRNRHKMIPIPKYTMSI